MTTRSLQSELQRPHEQNQRVLRVAFALAGAFVVIFGVGLLLGLTVVGRHGHGPIASWDGTVQSWELHHRAGLVGISKVIAFLGDAPKLAVVVLVLSALWWLVSRALVAVVPLIAYVGGEAQVYFIREIVHRHRPPTAVYPAVGAVPGVHETSWSFPSGHAVAVTAVLFAIAGIAARHWRTWWPWLVSGAASLFVADTRLVLGVHWFSDVAFGLVIGCAWGIAVARASAAIDWEMVREMLLRLRKPTASEPAGPPPDVSL